MQVNNKVPQTSLTKNTNTKSKAQEKSQAVGWGYANFSKETHETFATEAQALAFRQYLIDERKFDPSGIRIEHRLADYTEKEYKDRFGTEPTAGCWNTKERWLVFYQGYTVSNNTPSGGKIYPNKGSTKDQEELAENIKSTYNDSASKLAANYNKAAINLNTNGKLAQANQTNSNIKKLK